MPASGRGPCGHGRTSRRARRGQRLDGRDRRMSLHNCPSKRGRDQAVAPAPSRPTPSMRRSSSWSVTPCRSGPRRSLRARYRERTMTGSAPVFRRARHYRAHRATVGDAPASGAARARPIPPGHSARAPDPADIWGRCPVPVRHPAARACRARRMCSADWGTGS